jgi:chitooligosaccharide deacetylase
MSLSRTCVKTVRFLNKHTVGLDLNRYRGVIDCWPNPRNAICLTFDDGPSGHSTFTILDELARHGVRATFFCTGKDAVAHPNLVQDIVASGHEVGSHSVNHPHFNNCNLRQVFSELAGSRRILETIGDCPVTCFRAPYGSFRWEIRPLSRLCGYQHLIGWDVGPIHDEIDSSAIADFVIERTVAGSIIDLHDGLTDQSAELSSAVSRAAAGSLRRILPELISRGFIFKTVSEQLTRSEASEEPLSA